MAAETSTATSKQTPSSSAESEIQCPSKKSKDPSPFSPPNQLFTGDITKMQPTVDGKPKGRNVSGRTWKVRTQKRASSLITKTKANNRSKTWSRHQSERTARRAALEREKELKERSRQAAIEKKERRLENERRRAENEFKNAQRFAQKLGSNADAKMKAMSKKQLRQIKKTRMNSRTGVVEYVPAYAK